MVRWTPNIPRAMLVQTAQPRIKRAGDQITGVPKAVESRRAGHPDGVECTATRVGILLHRTSHAIVQALPAYTRLDRHGVLWTPDLQLLSELVVDAFGSTGGRS
jgi:hypothetical protein